MSPVDIDALAELVYLRRNHGVLHIGALTRQVTLGRSAVVASGWPLLRQAVRGARGRICSTGTVASSCARPGRAGELPTALSALDARFHRRSRGGMRALVEIEVPPLPAGARTGFAGGPPGEHLPAAAAAVVVAPGHAAVALMGIWPEPVRARAAEVALRQGATVSEAARLAGELVRDGAHAALVASLVAGALEGVQVPAR